MQPEKPAKIRTEHLPNISLESFLFLLMGWDWVHLVLRPLFGLLYQPRMIDDECGLVGGMRIGRGIRITQRKLASVPLCPQQIPHDLTWAWSRRLIAWAMILPSPRQTNYHISAMGGLHCRRTDPSLHAGKYRLPTCVNKNRDWHGNDVVYTAGIEVYLCHLTLECYRP
jgi:hypothetical protein